MKTISFAVPCYNSAAYMDKCIESLLACGDDIEIIIVDDGSEFTALNDLADRIRHAADNIKAPATNAPF